MLKMPDGSMVVSTPDQIQELKSLPEDQRLKRLAEMEAVRDEGGPHEYAT
jgi:hypothetical protein